MKKSLMGIVCLLLIAAGSASTGGQRTLRERLLAGKTDPSVGMEFIDVQVVMKGDDHLLQVLAISRGELRQDIGRGTGRAGETFGLWHAYQTGDKSWVSNGVVYDLAASAAGGIQTGRGLTAASIAGDTQLTAASDSSGRLHVIITSSASGGKYLYVVRDTDSRWRAVTSQTGQDDLAEMCLWTPGGGSGLIRLGGMKGGGGGSRIAEYALSPAGGDRSLFPESLPANAFAVSSSSRTSYFLLQLPGGEFQAVDRDVATGKWNLDQQKFMRGFRDPIGGAALRSMCGFPDVNGLPQVVGLAGGGGVVHIYRDEIGTWYNNGVALQAGNLRRISGCLDARGIINVIGLTDNGRIWHGYRAENHQWRDNGLFDF